MYKNGKEWKDPCWQLPSFSKNFETATPFTSKGAPFRPSRTTVFPRKYVSRIYNSELLKCFEEKLSIWKWLWEKGWTFLYVVEIVKIAFIVCNPVIYTFKGHNFVYIKKRFDVNFFILHVQCTLKNNNIFVDFSSFFRVRIFSVPSACTFSPYHRSSFLFSAIDLPSKPLLSHFMFKFFWIWISKNCINEL